MALCGIGELGVLGALLLGRGWIVGVPLFGEEGGGGERKIWSCNVTIIIFAVWHLTHSAGQYPNQVVSFIVC